MRKASAHDRHQDEKLADILSKTEIMVLKFHQNSGLSQRRGQALLDMLRHPEFEMKDVQSNTIVPLLWRLELHFMKCAVTVYNVWKPGDGNPRLELVIRDYLEVVKEFMHDKRWRGQFDLVFRPNFDAVGRLLIGPPCSALSWERPVSARPVLARYRQVPA